MKPTHTYKEICKKLKYGDTADLTAEMLTVTVEDGETPVHFAFANGYGDQIPEGILTADILTLQNISGKTPYDRAVENNTADKIPVALRKQCEDIHATNQP